MDVAAEHGRSDTEAQPFVQMLDEAVNEVIGRLVAPVDQRVFAVDRLRARVVVGEPGDIGVVLPKIGARRPHVGLELAGISPMQVAHGGGQHDDVAGGQAVAQDQLPHRGSSVHQTHPDGVTRTSAKRSDTAWATDGQPYRRQRRSRPARAWGSSCRCRAARHRSRDRHR